MPVKLLFCDLDGTLVSRGQPLSEDNLEMLQSLRKAGIILAVASGRSPYSLSKILHPRMPFDYAIFSTGAGVMNWPNQEILLRRELNEAQVQNALDILQQEKIDTMIQAPLPDNHHFRYCRYSPENDSTTDFQLRLRLYASCCRPLQQPVWRGAASQLLAILSPEDPRYPRILPQLRDFSVVRATSPLDGRSIWLEIFAPGVNKASAASWLSNTFPVPPITYALGNDHNDFDLLAWARYSLVAADSPPELLQQFQALPAEPESFLRKAAGIWQLL